MSCPFLRPIDAGQDGSETFACEPPVQLAGRNLLPSDLHEYCLTEAGYEACPRYLSCVAREEHSPWVRWF